MCIHSSHGRVVRTIPVFVLVVLVCAAGCSMRDAPVPQPAGPAGNITVVPVPVIPNVHYVDSVGRNFLFRGAHPVTERDGSPPKFHEEALQSAIRNASQEAGRELPENFTLIDISLLWAENPEDNNRERALLHAEDAFFTSRPELGRLHMWPMHGTELDPADPSAAAHREYLAEHLDEWLPDPLIGRVDTVRKYLEDPEAEGVSGPVVVYVHCYGGCDRTGELIGAYSLRYLNLTWEEARDLNGKRCRPDRGYDKANCNTLQWYGIWLNRTEGRPINWDADPPCYRPGS